MRGRGPVKEPGGTTRRRRSDLERFRLKGLIPQETKEKIVILRPLVEMIAAMFGPHLEVVLHDLRNPEHSIVAIANGHVTNRQIGGPIIGGPIADKAFSLLHEPGREARALVNYTTVTRDGRKLKSASLVYYSRLTGQPIVSLCLNYDLTGVHAARSALDALLGVDGIRDLPPNEEDGQRSAVDVDAMVRTTVDHIIASTGKPVALMEKVEKSTVVAALDETGLFMIRGSVDRVARALAISRFTVYNYLKQIRNRKGK